MMMLTNMPARSVGLPSYGGGPACCRRG